jgi:hypothetical protein
MEDVKKVQSLSTKSLGFTPKEIRKLVEGQEGAVFLARYGGVVESSFSGESSKGDWVGFKGQFMCLTKDGNKLQSSVAYFPSQISKSIVEKISDGLADIEIKADIYVIESDKNPSGYAYMCEPVITAEAQEKFKRLASDVFENNLPKTLMIEKKSKK